MLTISDSTKQRLTQAFTQEQAEVLVEVITESHKNLVQKNDFDELKGIVKDLALAQKRTEENLSNLTSRVDKLTDRVEQLAEAQKRTEEKVEQLAQAQKRTEEKVGQLIESLEKTQVTVRELGRQLGGLTESFGGTLEYWAFDTLPEVVEKHWDMDVKSVKSEYFDINIKGGTKKGIAEVDIVIRGKIDNNPVVVFGEVKSNITPNEIRKFIDTVENIIESNPYDFENTETRIVFFGYRAHREAKDLILEKKAYMVFANGKFL